MLQDTKKLDKGREKPELRGSSLERCFVPIGNSTRMYVVEIVLSRFLDKFLASRPCSAWKEILILLAMSNPALDRRLGT